MQVVYANEYRVVVAINQLDSFLHATIEIGGYQSGKLAYSVIHVHHIVAKLQLVEFFQSNDGFAASCVLRTKTYTVIAIKYLVIGIAADFCLIINESLV